MNVYQLDNEGFYRETITADPDPLAPGQFLIPGGCVTTPPPTFQGGKRARWNGSAWELVRAVNVPPPPALTNAERLELAREKAVVERFQLKIAARRLGMLQAIKAYVGEDDDLKDIWADATTFRRTSRFIRRLPFTATELDALFAAAAAIEP